jgi:hypothetical protein
VRPLCMYFENVRCMLRGWCPLVTGAIRLVLRDVLLHVEQQISKIIFISILHETVDNTKMNVVTTG